ncbi:UNVERIFIED_CONTAM: hypothetical protein Sangu_3213200 [Sesamum angustifolium]|uniref:Tify domain-containing protein n=1 Tax=Sesamum angustifolium TaxID=2727405 RepID=A0AAW2JK37_9LAMI
MDSGEIVVSSIRAGMKREFAMMMKAQSEIGALPAGRRRMTRSQSTAGSSKGNVRSADKRREAEKVGAELRETCSGLEDPDKVKGSLQTGLLEGYMFVIFMAPRGGVGQNLNFVELFRELAYYVLVMNARKESGNKRPPQYIFLDNGNSLRDVLNACKANLSESLESVILNAIGRSNYTTAFCINCKELIPEAGAGRSMLLCDACVLQKESDASDALIGDASRRDLRMHKSVLAEDVLPEGTALSYVMRREKKLEGYKKDGGIFCPCCKQVVSPSQFEAHAGFASRRKPYMSIYTSNGVSLHQLSLELSKIRDHLQRNMMISVQYVRMEEICYAVQTVHEAFTLTPIFMRSSSNFFVVVL